MSLLFFTIFLNRPYVDVGIYFPDTNFNDKWDVVRWFVDFRVEHVSTKT